jgi:hypothetical protein
MQQAEIDPGKRPGLTTAEREELARLRRKYWCCVKNGRS